MRLSLRKGLLYSILGFLIFLFFPLITYHRNDDYSLVVKDKNGEVLRIFLNSREQWCLPPEDSIEVPEKLKKAVLFYEDRYFYLHPGVNPVSLVRAALQNFRQKRIVSGASTLTMQLVRLKHPRERTVMNKGIEIFTALRYESHLSKKRILGEYLNHAPYGGNIIGYRTASLKYFNKQARELSWAEAATLAVLPNSPGLISPSANTEQLKKKRDQLLKKLLKKEVIDSIVYRHAITEEIPERTYPFEIYAPHLTRRIARTDPKAKIVTTTIDKDLQDYSEYLCKLYAENLRMLGVRNISLLIAETQTGNVRAYVGNPDFFDFESNGQVDGVRAPRSSGSTLKPFLYALSMDEGIILPQTLIKDVPTFYEAFSPSNADEKYNGVVTAREALVRSLNIPAVRLLNAYGLYNFYVFLQQAGVSTLFRTAEEYGLPLIIGGAEINLWDLVMLYRGLANEGTFYPNTFLKDDRLNASSSAQLISPGACYLVLDILKDLRRPGVEYYWKRYSNPHAIAWKTGTSYGHKDAWAVGVTPDWTIGVWVGNFTGEGNLNLAGASSAGPLLFEMLNYLPENGTDRWFHTDESNMKEVILCKETGFKAGENCDRKTSVRAPVNMKSLKLCPYHKKLYTDASLSYEVCSYCWDSNYTSNNYLIYPSEVNYYLKLQGQFVENIPPHNPACTKKGSIVPIEIIYPLDSAQIWLPRDFGGAVQELIARCTHQNDSGLIYWYLNDTYLGTTKQNHTLSIKPRLGKNTFLISDEQGNEVSSVFRVYVEE